MNKKSIIDEAKKILADYRALDEDKRNYEHENWHCVNVKRRSDYIDMEQVITEPELYKNHWYYKKQGADIKKYRGKLAGFSLSDDDYYNWLNFSGWDLLNYEISDIEDITKDAKDEHKKFKYLRESYGWAKDKSILSLGRMGGWACFQDTAGGIADELEDWLEYNADDSTYLEYIKANANDLKDAIEEIEYIKNYIDRFNKNLKWADEIFFRLSERIEEIEEEEKQAKKEANDRRNDVELLKKDILFDAENMSRRLHEHKKDKELKKNVNRHLTGIVKLVE